MREKYFWSIADEGKQIQVLQSVSFFSSSPRFLLLELTDGWEDESVATRNRIPG